MTGVEVLDGSSVAPPRDNGELVFEAPWQSRAFGVAADLVDAGHCTWNDFRHHLIDVIGEWEELKGGEQPKWDYYSCWLTALERIVNSLSLLDLAEVDARAGLYAARAHGHDH